MYSFLSSQGRSKLMDVRSDSIPSLRDDRGEEEVVWSPLGSVLTICGSNGLKHHGKIAIVYFMHLDIAFTILATNAISLSIIDTKFKDRVPGQVSEKPGLRFSAGDKIAGKFLHNGSCTKRINARQGEGNIPSMVIGKDVQPQSSILLTGRRGSRLHSCCRWIECGMSGWTRSRPRGWRISETSSWCRSGLKRGWC